VRSVCPEKASFGADFDGVTLAAVPQARRAIRGKYANPLQIGPVFGYNPDSGKR
jgi:hypothetical protein